MHTTDAYLQHHADRTARLRSSAGHRTSDRTATATARGGRVTGLRSWTSAVRMRARPADGAALAGACH